MYRRLIIFIAGLLCCTLLSAQEFSGGARGTVVNRADRSKIEGATLTLLQGAEELSSARSAADGTFLFEGLDNGSYTLRIVAPEFLETDINFSVENGLVKNMFNIYMTPTQNVVEVDDSSFSEFDLDDSGYNDSPTVLFDQNDVFSNMAGYKFSSVRFRARGYASESQDVYLAGIKLNDAITGYGPFSLWSGLNEATRSKDVTNGLAVSKYGFGGVNGVTNLYGNASSMRTGLRGSLLTNSSLYRFCARLSYATGETDSGWAYAFNISTRLGNNDWIKGVFYQSFGYYASAERNWHDVHKLGFTLMAAPGQRGAQNSSTQEVYDLMGDNMYNSNWGWYNGHIKNARVRRTHEPIAIAKYDFTPSQKFEASATVLYRFGYNGYSALDWYDAADPRPDYYRNLPSYFYSEVEDLDKRELQKSYWAREAWETDMDGIAHLNWQRLYSVNRNSLDADGKARSKYVLEERHVDQRDLNAALTMQWKPFAGLTLNGGVNARRNITENYKVLKDLLGGQYFMDIDNFAERDFASSAAKTQNDLDAYLKTGKTPIIYRGQKYGYDYNAHVRKLEGWLNASFAKGAVSGNIAGRYGREILWREGLLRKGLFAGLDPDGNEIIVDGVNLTSYDSYGNVITSLGESKHLSFNTYGVKGSLSFVLGGSMRLYANAGYLTDAPHFNMAFLSPRTRNSIVPDLDLTKTFSADVNYQFANKGYNVRVTAFYTTIDDQTDVMSFYDDSHSAFTNFAMSNIDQRHMGVEMGFNVPLPIPSLSLQGALSMGEYVYTSTPFMTQTVDNSSEMLVEHQQVPYWKSHPVFKRDASGLPTKEVDHFQKHYVPSTPQMAAALGLNYNYKYWFIDLDFDYFGNSYLDMNPLYRTDMATSGADGVPTPVEVEYMCDQERFKDAFLLNFSVGKSWYIKSRQLGFSLQLNNLLNNRGVKTGGYEQTRIIDNTKYDTRYYRFDSKYFYMSGFNYMLNIYFRF